MTTLLAWAAKRVVMARIQAWVDLAQPGDPLYQIPVDYTMATVPERVCIFGDRVRSTRTQTSAEHAVLFREDITVGIRVRVNEPGGDDESAERTAEAICQRIAVAVSAEPRISTGSVAVTATDQDPTVLSPEPDPYVTANVLLTVSLSMTSPGS